MKIVYAATQEQEEEIRRLVEKFYQEIFPLYFSDDRIRELEHSKVLSTSGKQINYQGTLKEAYYVIASLQTLISILESGNPRLEYEWIFYNNAQTLNKHGIHFPFCYEQFTGEKNLEKSYFSLYQKAANEKLI